MYLLAGRFQGEGILHPGRLLVCSGHKWLLLVWSSGKIEHPCSHCHHHLRSRLPWFCFFVIQAYANAFAIIIEFIIGVPDSVPRTHEIDFVAAG